MPIRIVDIAKKAGVSAGTVDRIIHRRGKVSQKAQKKVEKAIEELGYEPDISARNLALKKELRLVCLLPNPQDVTYWERPDAGIDKAISELSSFKVIIEKVYFSFRVKDFERACEQVLAMLPDGVLYVPVFMEKSMLFSEQLHAAKIPFVHINIHHSETKPLSFIGQNPIVAGKVAARMCGMALKKEDEITIVYPSESRQEYAHHRERVEGFMQYFETWGKKTPLIRHLHLRYRTKTNVHEQILLEHFNHLPHVRIIYTPNSRAYRIAAILKRHHIHHKILIGFDTLEKNVAFLKEGYIHTLIGQRSETQGYQGVMLLFDKLFKKENIEKNYFLPIDILNDLNIDFYQGE